MNKKSLATTFRRSIRNVGTIEKGMIVSRDHEGVSWISG